ncbi:MAG: hypothetical protein J7M09_05715 [Deltaproteobacteria bacterium]|nr:hypothetical protein [Candidatus Tharpella sp.]
MVSEITNFFNTIGKPVAIGTLVEYYDYIKAVEYLICVGFLIAFPIFYRKVIKYDKDADNGNK